MSKTFHFGPDHVDYQWDPITLEGGLSDVIEALRGILAEAAHPGSFTEVTVWEGPKAAARPGNWKKRGVDQAEALLGERIEQ